MLMRMHSDGLGIRPNFFPDSILDVQVSWDSSDPVYLPLDACHFSKSLPIAEERIEFC
jgi:hypothetical protein